MPALFKYFLFAGDVVGLMFVPVVLIRKRSPVSAIAWSLTVVFIPWLGVLFFLVFGASRIRRRLKRKIFHRSRFLRIWAASKNQEMGVVNAPTWADMDRYSQRAGGSPPSDGNSLKHYEDGVAAFRDKFDAIRAATRHVHVEYFILQDDATGRELVALLAEKARQGVEVRLLVDDIGSRHSPRMLEGLRRAGGRAAAFLPARLIRTTFNFGLRNHRKILVCDGKVGFVGGMNVGDEYLGKSKEFGFWRDSHLRVDGPAVLALQRVFVEDWDFASGELLTGDGYFPRPDTSGDTRLQVVWSGPDQENNAARETYFGAITAARKRLWIATPYLVPDGAILAGLRSAALRGVDVRILTQSYPPDHWLTYWAGRYFWEEMLPVGIRIFEYRKGMMHAKVMLADDAWASVGSANLDIRSIRLNFEISCHIHTPSVVQELERIFEKDLEDSKEVAYSEFRRRPWRAQLAENVCRLFSPLL